MGANIPLPALQVRPPEQQSNTMQMLQQVMSLKNAQQQQESGELDLQAKQRALQDEQTIRQVLSANKGDLHAALPELAGKINPKTFMGLDKYNVDKKKDLAEIDSKELATKQDINSRMLQLIDTASKLPPDQYAAQYPQIAAAAKELKPDLKIDPAQMIPQAMLPQFGLGLQTEAQYIAREKAKREQEDHEAKLPGEKADSAIKQAEAASIAQGGMTQQMADSKYRALQTKQRLGQPLSPEDKAFAGAYEKQKTLNTQIRVDAMGQNREYPVLDTKNGNTLQYISAADLNAANHAQPGRYVPAGEGGKALNKTALIEDIRGTIQQARTSLQNPKMPEFTAAQRSAIALALGGQEPATALSAAFRGGVLGSLSQEQQDYLINHAQLVENAMAMRSVLGAGQGSDDMRRAIKETIPGPNTPSKAYALKQLDKFEATLNRLSRGVATVPLKNEAPAADAGNSAAPTAIGPNGHKIVVKDGKWVDAQTGKPIQ